MNDCVFESRVLYGSGISENLEFDSESETGSFLNSISSPRRVLSRETRHRVRDKRFGNFGLTDIQLIDMMNYQLGQQMF